MSLATAARTQRSVFSAGRCRHQSRAQRTVRAINNKYILVPTGDGSVEHLGGETADKPAAINLAEGVYEVGRVAPADIVIPIPTISSRHAIIRIEEERIAVTDLNSTNGTMVNGTEIDAMAAATVNIGDEVVFGDEHLAKFKLELAPVSPEPPSPAPAADAEPEPVAA